MTGISSSGLDSMIACIRDDLTDIIMEIESLLTHYQNDRTDKTYDLNEITFLLSVLAKHVREKRSHYKQN